MKAIYSWCYFFSNLSRVNVENQVLKSGYTSRDLIILENDDPGGIFEFSPESRGPYVIKVSMKKFTSVLYLEIQKSDLKGFEFLWIFFKGRRFCGTPYNSVQGSSSEAISTLPSRAKR